MSAAFSQRCPVVLGVMDVVHPMLGSVVSHPAHSPRWMSRWLVAAGVYNLAWGALTVLYPGWLFDLTGMEHPNYPFIWQCVGMIVGVYGVGYLAAAADPVRHWPIVLVGFLGKLFGPVGYALGVARGEVPPAFGWTLPTNDLLWWIPFGLILWQAWRAGSRGWNPLRESRAA